MSIIGALVLTSYFLYHWKANHKANLYLGLFLALVSMNNIYFLLGHQTSVLLDIPYLIHAIDGLRLLWGALLYFFIEAFTGKQPLQKRVAYLHFVPALLAMAYFTYTLLYSPMANASSYTSAILQHKPVYYQWYWVIVYFSNVAYLMASLLKLGKIRIGMSNTFNDLDKKRYNWLFTSIIGLAVIHFMIPLIYKTLSSHLFALLPIFVVALEGVWLWKIYQDAAIFQYQAGPTPKSTEENSRFSATYPTLESAKQALNSFFIEQKPYLKPDLNIRMLSESFGMPSYQVSQVINQGFEKNFFDLVNHFRVEEAKARLLDKQYKHLTLEGIGYECGFNSKSSFYAVFKKYTQQTPSEFRKNTLEQQSDNRDDVSSEMES